MNYKSALLDFEMPYYQKEEGIHQYLIFMSKIKDFSTLHRIRPKKVDPRDDTSSLGTWVEEALCLGERHGEGARRAPWARAMSKMEKWPRVRALRRLWVRVFEVMCVKRDIKWRGTRLQGGRGKWGIHRVFGVCEMEKLGLEGLKRDNRVTFCFRTTSLEFRTTCAMALRVQNYIMLCENFGECAE